MISTPTDLIAYLKALFVQNSLVASVVTGEQMRPEESTLNDARYPQVDIETPTYNYPIGDQSASMHTRVYILADVNSGTHADIDRATDICFRIGKIALDTIKTHSYEPEIDIALVGNNIELNPVEGKGSDQVRGWVLELEVEADESLCGDDLILDPDDVIIPLFTWENDNEDPAGFSITIEDHTIHTGSDSDHEVSWYWKEEYAQPAATTFDAQAGLEGEAIEDGPTFRIVHVWLRIRLNDLSRDLLAYAEINSRRAKGRSVPFMPYHPY